MTSKLNATNFYMFKRSGTTDEKNHTGKHNTELSTGAKTNRSFASLYKGKRSEAFHVCVVKRVTE